MKFLFGGRNMREKSEQYKEASNVKNLSEFEYLEAISNGMAKNKDQELYLRTYAWWTINDLIRYRAIVDQVENEQSIFSPEAIQNLKNLYSKFDAEKQQERLLKAEIARELGQFEEASSLLLIDFSDHFRKAASLIYMLAEKQDSLVREIIE